MGEISFKENELYQEIELFVDGEKIGEAEVEIKGKMLSRLSIFPPYQDKGYGTQIVSMLNEEVRMQCTVGQCGQCKSDTHL